jgi:hypothetical protein
MRRLKLKLERAKKHIVDFKETWDAFVDGGAYPFTSKDDPNTGERIYKLTDAALIPTNIPLILGDAIHNLRSALDHLAYQLVSVGPHPRWRSKVYFPIADSPKEFVSALRRIKKRLRHDAVEPLAAIEAYRGGAGELLWQLNELDIIDKHHLLLPVDPQNVVHSMSPREVGSISRNFLGVFPISPEIAHRNLLQHSETPTLAPQAGDILARIPKADVQDNMYIPFEVAFRKPEIVRGKPVIVFLHQAADGIGSIISEFDRLGLLRPAN